MSLGLLIFGLFEAIEAFLFFRLGLQLGGLAGAADVHRVVSLLGGREVRADFRVTVPIFLTEHRVGGTCLFFTLRDEGIHAGRQRGDDIGILLGDVDVLFRIVDEIEQFDFGEEKGTLFNC